MKKIILPIVILAAIFAAAVPSIFGLKAEDVYREKLAEFAIPGILGVEVVSYERGWLSSKAQVLIELEAAGAARLSPEVKQLTTYLLQDTIYHGPFTMALGEFATRPAPALALAVVDSALFFDDEPDLYETLFAQAPLFISRTTVDFSGDVHSTAYSQPMKAEISELGATIDWKGFVVSMEQAGQQLDYTVDGEGLTISAQGIDLMINGWREAGQLTHHGNGLFTGEVKGALDGATSNSGPEILLSFGGLTYEKSSHLTGALMDGQFSMEAAEAIVIGETYGPTLFKAEASNIAAAQLTALIGGLNNTIADLPFAEQEDNGEEDSDNLIAMLGEEDAQLLIEVLEASPRLAISEFSFKTAEGDTTGTAEAGFNGEGLAEKLSSEELVSRVYAQWSFQMPLELALKLVASTPEVEMRAMEQLLAQNPNAFPTPEQTEAMTRELGQAMIDTFAQQGYILISPEALTVSGSLKDKQLTIGTQVLPLEKGQ